MAINKPALLSSQSESTSMSLKFQLESGGERTMSFKYIKEDLTDEEVTSAMAAIVANGIAWEDRPIDAIEAKKTVTNTTKYDIGK